MLPPRMPRTDSHPLCRNLLQVRQFDAKFCEESLVEIARYDVDRAIRLQAEARRWSILVVGFADKTHGEFRVGIICVHVYMCPYQIVWCVSLPY